MYIVIITLSKYLSKLWITFTGFFYSEVKLRISVDPDLSELSLDKVTLWSTCWRSRPGSGVVCFYDQRFISVSIWQFFFIKCVKSGLKPIAVRVLLSKKLGTWQNESMLRKELKQCFKIHLFKTLQNYVFPYCVTCQDAAHAVICSQLANYSWL